MRLEEILLCATAPQSQEQGAGIIALHDIQSTTLLATFKQTSAAARCSAVLESNGTRGGFILAAQPDKSLLNVYNFQKV
jgi:pre-rRNA-processing protein IPI3